MGTINYKTSDYITLGIKPYDAASIAADPDFIAWIKEEGREADADEIAQETAATYYEDDAANYDSIIKKYDFYFFHIALKPGYYEGLYIDIESNYPVFFDDYEEKREALKEIAKVKEFLTECAGVGFIACFPSWCTGYADHAETLKEIKKAAEEMRESIKATPTYRQWKKEA